MKTKTIRIPKKGGGTRLQRVQVLKSGKFKFIKNLRKTKTPRKSTKKKTSRKGRFMGKRKRRGGKSMIPTAFKLVRLGALAAPAIHAAIEPGIPPDEKLHRAMAYYTGFAYKTGEFRASWLVRGWGPYLMACLTTYGIPKLTSILRRL